MDFDLRQSVCGTVKVKISGVNTENTNMFLYPLWHSYNPVYTNTPVLTGSAATSQRERVGLWNASLFAELPGQRPNSQPRLFPFYDTIPNTIDAVGWVYIGFL